MKNMPEALRIELAALAGRPEAEIDFSDIPATTEADWQGSERGRFYKPIKKQLTVRIDADILEWLKSEEKVGYQTRINAILRHAMLQTRSATSHKT